MKLPICLSLSLILDPLSSLTACICKTFASLTLIRKDLGAPPAPIQCSLHSNPNRWNLCLQDLCLRQGPFAYSLHSQGMVMTPCTLSLMSNPRGRSLTCFRIWSIKHRFTLSSESLSHRQCPMFWGTPPHFSSIQSYISLQMDFCDHRPSLALLECLKWLYWTSSPPHVKPCFSLGSETATGRKAFCIHTCLHSHSTHFINITRHPCSRKPYSLPCTEHRPLYVWGDGLPPAGLSHTGYRAEAVLSEIFFI